MGEVIGIQEQIVHKQEVGSRIAEGFAFGLLGVILFSMSLPATRAAVPELGSIVVGLGRAIVAAGLAGLLLWARHERWPARKYWRGLGIVGLGVVIGFPLFSALALASLPSSHGAVITGLLPAATAVMGVLRAGDRPPLMFWLSCVAGVGAVLLFAISEGAGSLQPGDGLMLIAVLLAGLGYAEGGRVAREIGGWQVICWALIFTAPFLIVPVALSIGSIHAPVSGQAWLGFAYVCSVSMFLGFFAWYRGLALGGVARVGQIQLLQPVLTLLWSAWLLGEAVRPTTFLASLLIIVCAGLCQWSYRQSKS